MSKAIEAPAGILELSAERDMWLRRELAAGRRGYERGRRDGYAEGYAEAERDMERRWREFARPMARQLQGPSYAELERRRWTLRGEVRTRETFALSHPGDYPGTGQPEHHQGAA
jgi:hypothetical protein